MPGLSLLAIPRVLESENVYRARIYSSLTLTQGIDRREKKYRKVVKEEVEIDRERTCYESSEKRELVEGVGVMGRLDGWSFRA